MGAKLSLPAVFAFSSSLSIANQHTGKCWWKTGTEEGRLGDIFIVLFIVSDIACYFPLFFLLWDF